MDIYEIHINDYDEIYALWRGTPGMGLSDADSIHNIEKFLIRNKGMCFCCKEEKKIIGTILCGHDGRRGYIYPVTAPQVSPCLPIPPPKLHDILRASSGVMPNCSQYVEKTA